MHTFIKRVTFKPLSGGRYRCNQTGKVLTRSQILSYVSGSLAGNTATVVGRADTSTPPKKKNAGFTHPSKYRAKHR